MGLGLNGPDELVSVAPVPPCLRISHGGPSKLDVQGVPVHLLASCAVLGWRRHYTPPHPPAKHCIASHHSKVSPASLLWPPPATFRCAFALTSPSLGRSLSPLLNSSFFFDVPVSSCLQSIFSESLLTRAAASQRSA